MRHQLFGTQLDGPVECINRAITASVAANRSARLVRLDSWVCSSRARAASRRPTGPKLRYDGLHFRDRGADDADHWLVDQVFTT